MALLHQWFYPKMSVWKLVTLFCVCMVLHGCADASPHRRHGKHHRGDVRRHHRGKSRGSHKPHNSYLSHSGQKHGLGLKDSRDFPASGIQSDEGVQPKDRQNTQDSRNNQHPTFFNLATRAEISVNATCGEEQPETYCKLVEHVKSRLPEQIQCGECNDRDPLRRHPITRAIDGSHGWWQSPSIANGKEYNYVTITLDLKQTFQVAYVIVKAANSPRPGNWILERSLDGVNYLPWQYFAMSSSECYNLYGVQGSRGIPSIISDDQVLCTSAFSRLQPLENGEIHISLVNGRPGENEPTQLLKEFTMARYVQLRFQRIQTLYADLMTFVYNDPKDLDPTVTNRYFYSIKDISIGGRCICRGSSSECIMDPQTGETRCECTGNTCGRECDQCCPLYNQKPWPAGNTVVSSVLCEECQCFGHADACVYNNTVADLGLSLNIYGEYDGGGVCQNCKHYTMGVNCEMCAEGFYRPSGVDPYDPYSCVQCDCNYVGTTGQCVKDDSRVHEEMYPGDCLCAVGYQGLHCEQCAPGYTGYPYCEPCPCNSAGSVNADICLGECVCKPHVCGDYCEKCLPGYFNLQPSNPLGCDQCFCFGITQDCSSSTLPSQCLTSLEDWLVTDFVGSGTIRPQSIADGSLYVTTQQAKEAGLNRALYWTAPPDFIGNKIASYGGVLEFMFSYSVNQTADSWSEEEGYLANLDLLIEGNGLTLGHSGVYYVEDDIHHIAMNLTENGWTHRGQTSIPTGTPASKEEFLTVLADIQRLLIRAGYHMFQQESRLHGVSLEVSSQTGTGPPLLSVEMCACPPGYQGTSCELCAPGYRRVGNILVGGTCEPCLCHGHSDVCDPYTGECVNCQHNTYGPQCDACVQGYTGDPTTGTKDACKPCACPLESSSNNFASGCDMRLDGLLQCDCDEGYEGNKCERCSIGYYGNPLQPGDYCKTCNCHGNSNPGHDCNTLSGECKNCQGNTEGLFCEKCKEGYYGTAWNGDCQACQCNIYGSVNDTCDLVSGQCECQPLYTGRDCGQCQEGYGNIVSGCESCDCHPVGSVVTLCDPVTGDCSCKQGVEGDSCDTCLPGYYGYSEEGCKECECSILGSHSSECNQTSGECACKEGVTGRMCDLCEENHWGLSSSGCEPCECNLNGAVSSQCDLDSGQCQCKAGVSGAKCDHCLPGYYGFSWEGCQECPVCPSAGQVCDSVTGDCSCPPNTLEPFCDKCVTGSWGYDPQLGCKQCLCDLEGSVAFNCDLETGQCLCRELYTGQKCDQCVHGHYSFPNCLACDCSIAGTLSHTCDEQGHCSCDDIGQCSCKEFTNSTQCNVCEPGTFGLEESNPRGCTECFCSGRTTNCLQAPYTWSLVDLPKEELTLTNDTEDDTAVKILPNLQKYLVVNQNTTNVLVEESDTHLPFYWSVPKEYLGDWTLSYNGEMRFTVEIPSHAKEGFSDFEPLTTPVPLVSLLGNFVLRLNYIPPVGEIAELRSERTFVVKFREDLWQRASGKKASRSELMTALQNIQTLLIRLNTDTKQPGTYSVKKFVLEKAIHAGRAELFDSLGVEYCVCPPGYTGLSCQDPAPGFYRVRPMTENVTLHLPNMEDLIGYSEPCLCNGHTPHCDPDTGHCINCSHNTEGDHCETCVKGYYGDPTDGSPDSCIQCECPVITEGQIPTCHADELGASSFVCDECPEGLTGDVCEECVPGYYGDTIQGCLKCECNPQGSRDSICNATTGQCNCYQGILGRACDQCAERHAVKDGLCIPCNVDCTGELFEVIDQVENQIQSMNITVEYLLPWQHLTDVDDDVAHLTQLGSIQVKPDTSFLDAVAQNISELESFGQKLEDTWDLVARRAQKAHGEDKQTKTAASELAKEIVDELGDVQSYTENALSDILGRIESKELDLDSTLETAEENLGTILQANFTMKAIEVERDRRLAASLLEKVKMYRQDHTLDLNSTSRDVHQVEDKLTDLLKHTAAASNVTDKAQLFNQKNKEGFEKITNLTDIVDEDQSSVLDTHSDGHRLNKEATQLLENSTANYVDIKKSSNHLFFDISGLEFQLSPLEGVLDELQDTVGSAVNHSQELNDLAAGLDSLFNDTRETASDPLMAVQAFENMADAIKDAEMAANRATNTARNASDVVLNTVNGTLAEQASMSRNRSQKAANQSQEMKDQLTLKLRPRLERYNKVVEDTTAANQLTEEKLGKIQNKIGNMTGENSEKIEAVKNNTMETDDQSSDVADRVKEIRENIDTNLRPKLDEMTDFELDGIVKANASVNAAREELLVVENTTARLQEHAQSIQRLGNNIAYDLAQLRENIRLAREQANNLRVSLYNPDSCFRRYKPKLKSGTTNSIRMHIKTNRTEQDMLLFLLATPGTPDFVALELVEGHVQFSWNTGAEDASVRHPLALEGWGDSGKEEDAWYEIKAERIAHLGQLSVKKLSSVYPAPRVDGKSSSPSHTKLDINTDTQVFIGGAPDNYQVPDFISNKSFSGCVGDVYLDGKPVGLYNFRELEGSGCSGCNPVPSPAEGENGIYQFDGTGYASREQVPYTSRFYSVIFKIKVIYEEALLFFTHNPHTGDYMAVEMKGGRVQFTFNVHGVSMAKLTTTSTYNTNTWVRVDARVQGLNALLTVEQETVEDFALDLGVQEMDLEDSQLYFAGSPSTVKGYLQLYNITSLSFLGCMRDVQVSSKGPFKINLKENLYIGMQTGCQSQARVVGLNGTGHLELPSQDLLRDAEVTFSFRTQAEDGLMLLSLGTDTSHFYSVSLLGGQVVAWFNGGGGLRTIESVYTFNDGDYHSVSVIKSNRLLELFVDDEQVGTSRLPSGDSRINTMPGQEGGLYIGGVPRGVGAEGSAATLEPFRGCISDVIITERLMTLDEPLTYHKADVGRCNVRELFENVTGNGDSKPNPGIPSFTVTVKRPGRPTTTPVPTTVKPDPTSCAVEGAFASYPDSVAFGDLKGSHAKVKVEKRSLKKDFDISMEFRTFYEDGLMVYITNGDNTAYVAVEHLGGKVIVSYKGTNMENRVNNSQILNDGSWQRLRLAKTETEITVQINEDSPIISSLNNGLDVDAPVYVGGLSAQVMVPEGMISESFKGCIRHFALTGQVVDFSALEAIMGVRRCKKHVELGAYFDGFGYAIYDENYRIGSEFVIELEMRTKNQDGVIVSIGDNAGKPALAVEMYQGQLQITAINDGGTFTARSEKCQFCLCDNQWHKVKAELIKNVVMLEVDGETTAGKSDSSVRELNTLSSLYIGGFPIYAPYQAASSSGTKFVGCMKNMKINNTDIRWHSMHNLLDVQVSGCPISLT